MKKLTSMLVSLVMVLSMAVTAFAAPATGSITIKDAANVSVANKTFAAYKVMDATMVNVNDPAKGISYTVPAELKEFYAARYTISQEAADFDEQVVAKIAEESDRFAFAREVLAAAKAAGISPKTATAGSVTSVTITDLPLGYYVIEDQGTATPISALILDTAGNVDATIKADKPSIDKKIDGTNDTDPSTEGMVETNNGAIGDKVPYVLTSRVPDMTGYEKYFFVVKDTLSKGLKFNNDVVITINGETIDPGQYDVTVTGGEEGQPTNVEIVFKNFIQYQDRAGKAIVIKYSATIDTDAVIGTAGNPNEVTLDYSHNPNIIPSGTPENPDKPGPEDQDVIGTTPEEITKTFVTGIEITKVDEKGNHLTGAEFELAGTRLNTVLVTKDVFTQSPDGTWYKLKDGTYTEEAPGDGTTDKYESTEVKYAKETKTETITKKEEVHYVGAVGSDGILRFDGLAAGDYVITELKAPDGYNMLKEPIKVTITCKTPDTAAGKCTWEVTLPGHISADGNIIEVEVVNKTGTELPETGGMGTTIFYVVGGMLVVGAVVTLIVRKRVGAGR